MQPSWGPVPVSGGLVALCLLCLSKRSKTLSKYPLTSTGTISYKPGAISLKFPQFKITVSVPAASEYSFGIFSSAPRLTSNSLLETASSAHSSARQIQHCVQTMLDTIRRENNDGIAGVESRPYVFPSGYRTFSKDSSYNLRTPLVVSKKLEERMVTRYGTKSNKNLSILGSLRLRHIRRGAV